MVLLTRRWWNPAQQSGRGELGEVLRATMRADQEQVPAHTNLYASVLAATEPRAGGTCANHPQHFFCQGFFFYLVSSFLISFPSIPILLSPFDNSGLCWWSPVSDNSILLLVPEPEPESPLATLLVVVVVCNQPIPLSGPPKLSASGLTSCPACT